VAKVIDARVSRRTVGVAEAIEDAFPRLAMHVERALRVVEAGHALLRRLRRQPPIDQLFRVGAGVLGTNLTGETIDIGHTLVSTLTVDGAELPQRAVARVLADALVDELADVAGAGSVHASLTGRTVARCGALRMAAPESAHERRVAVAVEYAPGA